MDTAPSSPLKVPRGHGEGEVAEGPLYVPAGAGAQAVAPLRPAKKPALQALQSAGEEADVVAEADPGAQGMQPLEVCPGAGL